MNAGTPAIEAVGLTRRYGEAIVLDLENLQVGQGEAVALIALVVVWLLPQDLLLVAAFVFLVVLAAYAMSGNYFMQTMFLTPCCCSS